MAVTDAVRDAAGTARSSPVFVAVVLLTLTAAAFSALMVGLMALRLDALLPGPFGQMGHFTELHHRAHDMTFAALFIPPALGLLAQLRRPEGNVAGMLTALIPGVALLIIVALAFVQGGGLRVLQPPWVMVMAGALLATVLHPAGQGFFRSFRRSRFNWTLVALMAAAAAPLLPFAFTNIALQASVTDDHAAAGHYGFMAAFALATLSLAALASLRPDGWRLTAWCAALLPAAVGAASLAYPAAASSLTMPWAIAAIVWATTVVVVTRRTSSTPPDASTDGVDLAEDVEGGGGALR